MRPHARTIHPKPGLPSEIMPSVKIPWMIEESTIILFAVILPEVHSELSFDLFVIQLSEYRIEKYKRSPSPPFTSHPQPQLQTETFNYS